MQVPLAPTLLLWTMYAGHLRARPVMTISERCIVFTTASTTVSESASGLEDTPSSRSPSTALSTRYNTRLAHNYASRSSPSPRAPTTPLQTEAALLRAPSSFTAGVPQSSAVPARASLRGRRSVCAGCVGLRRVGSRGEEAGASDVVTQRVCNACQKKVTGTSSSSSLVFRNQVESFSVVLGMNLDLFSR